MREIEKDKLYYFVLAYLNPQKVVIVKSPADNKKQKQFLGYEWSAAKGNEGIKLISDEKGRHLTPLYDADNRYNPEKINCYIQQNFSGQSVDVPEILQSYLYTARLTDMLDFRRKNFDKHISLTPKKNTHIESKWESVKLGEIIETIESGSRPQGGVSNINSGALSLGGEHIHNSDGTINLTTPKYVPFRFFESAPKGILQINDILLCKDGALTGKVAFLHNELIGQKAMVNEHIFILRCKNIINQLYLFNFLFSEYGQRLLKLNITG